MNKKSKKIEILKNECYTYFDIAIRKSRIIRKAIDYIETTLIEKGKTKLELNGNEISTLLNILKGEE